MELTKKIIKAKLQEVMDPELAISIVDLGFIYDIKISSGNQVAIKMTLTSAGCPMYPLMENQVRKKLKELGINNDKLKLELTFDPPWSTDKMTKKGKRLLGF